MRMKPTLFALLASLFLAAGAARADDLADTKALIGRQLEQIKKGDVAGLKAGFTDRVKDKVTAEKVKKAAPDLEEATVDDLVASVAAADGGLKIKMKSGRTLTTLVKVDGKWKADTIWFK